MQFLEIEDTGRNEDCTIGIGTDSTIGIMFSNRLWIRSLQIDSGMYVDIMIFIMIQDDSASLWMQLQSSKWFVTNNGNCCPIWMSSCVPHCFDILQVLADCLLTVIPHFLALQVPPMGPWKSAMMFLPASQKVCRFFPPYKNCTAVYIPGKHLFVPSAHVRFVTNSSWYWKFHPTISERSVPHTSGEKMAADSTGGRSSVFQNQFSTRKVKDVPLSVHCFTLVADMESLIISMMHSFTYPTMRKDALDTYDTSWFSIYL